MPCGLPIECFPVYEKMLDKRPNLVDAVNIMFTGAVAESTSAQYMYNAVVREFFQFCKTEKAEFLNFSAATVLEFLAVSFTNRRHLGSSGLSYLP